MILRALIIFLLIVPRLVHADDKIVRLHAPDALTDRGLLKFILPRFSLKTQVRVELVPEASGADLVFGDKGRALFEGEGAVWKFSVQSPDHPGTKKLVTWLTSETGLRTITGFAPEGEPLFGPPSAVEKEVVVVTLDGDAELGHKVSRDKCTRCHAVDEATRGWGIGSTPSFGILRALSDWEQRFSAFYVLNPHPAFTQITDVTEPFPIDRPSPISPIELNLDELEALMAYVAAMPAADLGRPIEHQ